MVLDLGDCDTDHVHAEEGGAGAQRLERVMWKPLSGPGNLESVPVSAGPQAPPSLHAWACLPLLCTVIQTLGRHRPPHPCPHSQQDTDLRPDSCPQLSQPPKLPLVWAPVISPT